MLHRTAFFSGMILVEVLASASAEGQKMCLDEALDLAVMAVEAM